VFSKHGPVDVILATERAYKDTTGDVDMEEDE
jgi:hypothetical protein